MPFASGSVSFRRLAVIGKAPLAIEQDMLDALSEHALRPSELATPQEEEYGWNGGRHILDGQFSFEHNVFADALHFALRIDTNKAPGDIKKAYTLIEEGAAAASNPSGFISKQQKREVKDSVGRKLEEELREGKYRRTKLLPMLWDLPSQTLYCSISNTALDKLREIFNRSFSLELQPLSAGSMALRRLEPQGKHRDYEDLRPSRFVSGPDGEGQYPEYPWVAKGPEPKDFLGNEFLLWLWYAAEHREAGVETEVGTVDIFFDRTLDLDCAYGQSGKDSLRSAGPARMPEARDGLRSGKMPRKAGLTWHAQRQQFDFSLAAESFSFGSVKLPDVEDADTARQLFEERVGLLRDFSRAADALFAAFLKQRANSGWESQVNSIRKWILQPAKVVAAVA